mgnify:CR=1 FL=1
MVAKGREDNLLPRQFFGPGGECTLLEYVLDSIWTVADEIYVVFNHEPSLKLIEAIAPFGVKVVIKEDSRSIVSMMATGFRASKSEHCLAVRENVPFLKPNVIFALFEAARGHDAAVPKWSDGRVEPLLAVYRRKALLSVASKTMGSDDAKTILDNLYAVRFVHVENELKPLDPELHSFFHVNTDEDLNKAKMLATTRLKP